MIITVEWLGFVLAALGIVNGWILYFVSQGSKRLGAIERHLAKLNGRVAVVETKMDDTEEDVRLLQRTVWK
jgi:hypothetical protein